MGLEEGQIDKPGYPEIFSERLKANRDKVCQLMNWDEERFNDEMKNPAVMVKAIQEIVLAKGGTLPKYGVDGDFGPETAEAVGKILEQMNARHERRVVMEEVDVLDIVVQAEDLLAQFEIKEGLSINLLNERMAKLIAYVREKFPQLRELCDDTEKMAHEFRKKFDSVDVVAIQSKKDWIRVFSDLFDVGMEDGPEDEFIAQEENWPALAIGFGLGLQFVGMMEAWIEGWPAGEEERLTKLMV